MAEEIMSNDTAKKVIERNLVVNQEDTEQESYNQVSIIKALSTENMAMRIQLKLEGYTFDYFKKVWIKTRSPIMNAEGVGNFMSILEGIGDQVNFSYFNEKDIPKLALQFFKDNYPQFIVYSEQFDLNPKDFNIIKTILKFWALSVLNNAKGAGHRNVIRGTLSEGILMRGLSPTYEEKKKGGFLSLFRKNKD